MWPTIAPIITFLFFLLYFRTWLQPEVRVGNEHYMSKPYDVHEKEFTCLHCSYAATKKVIVFYFHTSFLKIKKIIPKFEVRMPQHGSLARPSI